MFRVSRGGAYNNSFQQLRSAWRDYVSPETSRSNRGFRVARTLSADVGAVTVTPGEH